MSLIMLFKIDKAFPKIKLFSLDCRYCLEIWGIKIGSMHFGIFKVIIKNL